MLAADGTTVLKPRTATFEEASVSLVCTCRENLFFFYPVRQTTSISLHFLLPN